MIQGSSPGSVTAASNPVACPYLGLPDDPRTHFAFATAAHRCHSGSKVEHIEVSQQVALCLVADYPACPRYIVPVPVSVAAGIADLPSRGLLTPNPIASGRPDRFSPFSPGIKPGRQVLAAAGIFVGIVFLATVVALAGLAVPGSRPVVPGSSPSPRVITPAASLGGPTGSVRPTATESLAPTPGPTASPTGSVRALPTTHIVRRGENLTSIARLYGVTLIALEQANAIKDPSLIVVGQRLIIPAH